MAVSHIGHVELRVPDVAKSVEFFTDFVGLRVTAQDGDSAYLRAWQDFDHHTLLLTEAPERELGHIGWRAADKASVLAIEDELATRGIETVWIDGAVGHGDAMRFYSPGGIPYEIYWEVEPYRSPDELTSRFPSHPITLQLRGASTRRIDHVGVNVDHVAAEQEFVTGVLGIHHRYYGTAPDDERQFSWVSRTSLSHEMSMVRNMPPLGGRGRFHHLAYFIESADDLLRLATVLIDNGYTLDWGPGRHGTSGATALYFKEPGGHRIEVWTGGLLIFAPDWEPIEWKGEVLYAVADIWGNSGLGEKFLSGTPVASELAPVVRSS